MDTSGLLIPPGMLVWASQELALPARFRRADLRSTKATIGATAMPTLANFAGSAASADREDSADISSLVCDDCADCKAELGQVLRAPNR